MHTHILRNRARERLSRLPYNTCTQPCSLDQGAFVLARLEAATGRATAV